MPRRRLLRDESGISSNAKGKTAPRSEICDLVGRGFVTGTLGMAGDDVPVGGRGAAIRFGQCTARTALVKGDFFLC